MVSFDAGAIPPQPTGVGRYAFSIANALSRRDDIELLILCRNGDYLRWKDAVPDSSVRRSFPDSRVGRVAVEQLLLGRRLGKMGVDLHHGPHYTMPTHAEVPVVVTIHDLTFVENPQWHEPFKVPFFRMAIRRAVHMANAIVCVSERTAISLKDNFTPKCPVVVAHHGIDRNLFSDTEPSVGYDDLVLDSFGISRPYIVFLGTLEPRKSVPILINAFNILANEDPDLRLVIAGRQGWAMNSVTDALDSSVDPSRIHMLGYVPDEKLPPLLRQAAVCAYPALEEGFGLPALEAMACGTALVTTSNVPAIELAPEVPWIVDAMMEDRGGSLHSVKGRSVKGTQYTSSGSGASDTQQLALFSKALASTVRDALNDNEQRIGRIKIGLSRAHEWTWEQSALKHMSAYKMALGLSGDGVE